MQGRLGDGLYNYLLGSGNTDKVWCVCVFSCCMFLFRMKAAFGHDFTEARGEFRIVIG